MSRKVTALEILIASPSDVAQERALLKEAILSWNDVHSADRGIFLHPVMWESMTIPELGEPGDRPQAMVNRQIVDACDALVGAFWMRLGTSTGVAESGTLEEIERMRAAKKPVLLYFSKQPLDQDRLDWPQFEALERFKRGVMSEGLIHEYKTPSELQSIFTRHLHGLVLRLEKREELSAGGEVASPTAPPSRAFTGPDPYPLSLDLEWKIEKMHPSPTSAAEQHDYRMVVRLRNDGTKTIRSWHIDLEVPTLLLHPGMAYGGLNRRRSNAEISVLQMTSEGRPALLPKDDVEMVLQYRVNHEIYYEHQEVFSQLVRATAYVEDEVARSTEKRVEDVTNF